MVTGYTKTDLGEQTLTVTYGGQTTTYKVNVKDYVTGIKVNPKEVRTEYNKELADLITENNITYTVTYAKAGDTSPVPLTEAMVSGYNKTSKQTQSLTVRYTDNNPDSFTNGQIIEGTLIVEADNPVIEITITKPTKDKYKHGENLDLTTGTVTIIYEDGSSRDIAITEDMVTENGEEVNMSPDSYNVTTQKVSKLLIISYTKDRRNWNYQLSNRDNK